MPMGQITDPQIAALLTEQRNLSSQIDRILASQERIERAMVDVAMVKKEQEHLLDAFRQLSAIAEVRAAAHHAMDKRLTALEWWHKYRLAQPAAILTLALAAWGYWQGFTESLDNFKANTNSKVQSLEFIVNSPAYERAMSEVNSRPVATGGKK